LIKRNKFVASGAPLDDDNGDSLTLTAPKNIVRFNAILNGQISGLLLKIGWQSRSDNNQIYNNTIVWNGRFRNDGPQRQGYGIRYYAAVEPSVGNVIIDNLLYGNASGDVLHRIWGQHGSDTVRDNERSSGSGPDAA
jgi:hypothetical protein